MKKLLGIIFSICLMFALLIASAELLLYSSLSWYEREYTKYNVQDEMIREISMESLLEVSDQMMDYLRGDRDDLIVYAVRDGVSQEFFTDREKAHMADVRKLFIAALWIARVCCAICIAIIAALLIIKRRERSATDAAGQHSPHDHSIQSVGTVSAALAKSYVGTSIVLTAGAGIIAYLFASNFNKYFIIFHHMFFDNDLWILYPDKDDMINMLPEGFFSDTAAAILIIYLTAVVLLFILSVVIIRRDKRRGRSA